MGGQRNLGLRSVLQVHWLEMSQAGCDQRGVESPEGFWSEVGISDWSQEGFLEEAAVEDEEGLWGREGLKVGKKFRACAEAQSMGV